jgi:peptidase E
LASCDILELDAFDADPLGLRKAIQALDPHVLWVTGGNTFFLRHFMQSSGFDKLAKELCAPAPGRRALVYVGQSAGSICAAASVEIAHFKGWDDPAKAPAPTLHYGLRLVGENTSVFPHYSFEKGHDALIALKSREFDGLNDPQHQVVPLKDDQAFVWSQTAAAADDDDDAVKNTQATSFVFSQDGALESLCSPPTLAPLAAPPLRETASGIEAEWCEGLAIAGGVPCEGEPAIDPSRVVQRGDSEWFEENPKSSTL